MVDEGACGQVGKGCEALYRAVRKEAEAGNFVITLGGVRRPYIVQYSTYRTSFM